MAYIKEDYSGYGYDNPDSEDKNKKDKKKVIEVKLNLDALKQLGKDSKEKIQSAVENIDLDELKQKGLEQKDKIQEKVEQISSDRQKNKIYNDVQKEMKQKNKKVESFLCPNCGASMEIIEDELHYRKIVCPSCGTSSNIIEKDKDRVKRERADQEIYNMKYAREHPVKHEFKIWYPMLFLLVLAVVALLISSSGGSDSSDANAQLKPPISCSDVKGMNYQDVKISFENAGFTNIQTVELKDLVVGWMKDDGDVEEVSVNGNPNYSTSDKFENNVPVIIRYHTYASSEDNATTSSDSNSQEILTMENCPELAAILTSNTDDDSAVIAFAEKYKGRTIKFDGCIRAMSYHGDYTTRFDILVSYSDYNPDSQPGPSFQFQDVGAYDLGISTLYLEDELAVGNNVTITAKVDNYNQKNLLFYLDPISVVKR